VWNSFFCFIFYSFVQKRDERFACTFCQHFFLFFFFSLFSFLLYDFPQLLRQHKIVFMSTFTSIESICNGRVYVRVSVLSRNVNTLHSFEVPLSEASALFWYDPVPLPTLRRWQAKWLEPHTLPIPAWIFDTASDLLRAESSDEEDRRPLLQRRHAMPLKRRHDEIGDGDSTTDPDSDSALSLNEVSQKRLTLALPN